MRHRITAFVFLCGVLHGQTLLDARGPIGNGMNQRFSNAVAPSRNGEVVLAYVGDGLIRQFSGSTLKQVRAGVLLPDFDVDTRFNLKTLSLGDQDGIGCLFGRVRRYGDRSATGWQSKTEDQTVLGLCETAPPFRSFFWVTPVAAVALHPDQRKLALIQADGTLDVHELTRGDAFKRGERLSSVATGLKDMTLILWTPAGQILALGDKAVRRVDPATGKSTKLFSIEKLAGSLLQDDGVARISPDGRFLVISKDDFGFFKGTSTLVSIYDLQAQKRVAQLNSPGRYKFVRWCFSLDGRSVVTMPGDTRIDLETGVVTSIPLHDASFKGVGEDESYGTITPLAAKGAYAMDIHESHMEDKTLRYGRWGFLATQADKEVLRRVENLADYAGSLTGNALEGYEQGRLDLNALVATWAANPSTFPILGLKAKTKLKLVSDLKARESALGSAPFYAFWYRISRQPEHLKKARSLAAGAADAALIKLVAGE